MEKEDIKSLADLIYDPEEDLFLSKQAAIGIAEKFYKELRDDAEKFVSFYKANEDKADELFGKYFELISPSKILRSMVNEKAMQRLIYENLLSMEKDLRKNSYNLEKMYKEMDKKSKGHYTDF
jgi:hypothetical protein